MRFFSFLASLVLIGVSAVGLTQYQQAAGVQLGDFFFCEKSNVGVCETVISSGDTVVWDYAVGSAGHTVTFCGVSCDEPTTSPLFDSGKILAGETFSFTFSEPREYLYYCEFHPTAMRGSVLVQPKQSSPQIQSTPTVAPSPTISIAGAPTPIPTFPGSGPESTSTDAPSPTISIAGAPTPIATFPGNGPESTSTDDGDPQIWLIVPIAAVAALAIFGIYLAFRWSRQ